jgi:coenzyme F420-reducing hydrogenase delta subunit
VKRISGLLDETGLNGQRIVMVNVSSAMAAQFAHMVKEMVDRIEKLGPSPLRQRGDITTPELED